MSNQLLIPPEIERNQSRELPQPSLWSTVEGDPSFWSSLTENLRARFFPRPQPALQLKSKPIPVVDPFYQQPIWVGIYEDFREVFFPRRLPPLQLESHAVAVSNPLERPRDRMSSLISAGVHVLVLAIILAVIFWHPKRPAVAEVVPPPNFNITPFMPISPGEKPMGGGGGGGDRSITPAAAGKLPTIAKTQFVPPDEVIRNPKPKLAVEPTVVMPANIKLPNSAMPNLGDPLTSVRGPASNGTGSAGGIGSGNSGGVGSGSGAGVGPGSGGGYGGGIYQVGNGVTGPKLIYQVDAEFSDQARMAKYQGVVVVQAVIDTQGLPRDLKVVQPLGMGLDEKALEAVKQYRFKPATFKGKAVAVIVDVDVDFHIY
jgi:TonB family protein